MSFVDAVRKVRVEYPLLWSSSKRNRRIEVYYWLDHGMFNTSLLK